MKLIQTLKDASLELKIVGFVAFSLIIGGIFIGFFSVLFIRADVFDTAATYANNTASIVTEHVNYLLTGDNLNAVREFAEKQKEILTGTKSIIVLNSEGRDIFLRKIQEADRIAVNKIQETKSQVIRKTKKEISFYNPLINSARCTGCHSDKPEGSIVGTVKVSISTSHAYEKVAYRVKVVLSYLFIGTLLLSVLLWLAFKITIINPIKTFENTAKDLSHGDLSSRIHVRFMDEMGRLGSSIIKASRDISKIIQRAVNVSNRVVNVTVDIEKESKKVIESSLIESEAINKTSQSIEELNKSIGEIAESASKLISTAEQTAVSSSEMVNTTEQIAKNSIELSIAIDSTSSSIEEVSTSIKEIASRSGELSVSVEDTLLIIREINSTIKEIELNTKESARLSEKVTSDATSIGMVAIEKTTEGMERIKATVQHTAVSIEKLSKRSEEIGNILNVIAEITDHTTLLAFNAAILAAQAGEYGKGFSVVADEIKDLAERTLYSTQEIASLIQSVQSEIKDAVTAMEEGTRTVNKGYMLIKDTEESFRGIIESSKQSTEMVSLIERGTFEQTKRVSFVTDAMVKIKNMSAQIAAATAEQSKEISLIISAAEKIRDITRHVKNTTIEQSKGENQLYESAENVSALLHEISNSINRQKVNTDNIYTSMEKIMTLPEANKNKVFAMNKNLRNLLKDAEVLITELNRFKLREEDEAEILKMGIVPLDAPAEMYSRFIPLKEHLERKLNETVELKLAVDFAGSIEDIGGGVTDICFMTPSTYIEAREKYGVEVLVKALRKGRPYHHTVIIAREGGRIGSMEDIKGAAFVNKNMPEKQKLLIKQALIELDYKKAADRAVLISIDPNYTGFVEASYEDYKEIKGLMQKFGLL
ncbi:MAG: PhnD/SsuA/transferrin family substrate-binding protein [Nitrospirae bacterium]|nr:PhnD/SsuA/transferrin family substrate-binding protein [Nitrospirota bacterium]